MWCFTAGLYPASADEYEGLAAAIERLNLNDASVTVKKETSDALGAGFRCATPITRHDLVLNINSIYGPLHLRGLLEASATESVAQLASYVTVVCVCYQHVLCPVLPPCAPWVPPRWLPGAVAP